MVTGAAAFGITVSVLFSGDMQGGWEDEDLCSSSLSSSSSSLVGFLVVFLGVRSSWFLSVGLEARPVGTVGTVGTVGLRSPIALALGSSVPGITLASFAFFFSVSSNEQEREEEGVCSLCGPRSQFFY